MSKKSEKYAESWTPERRKKQREIILEIKPWVKSTGPTSMEGKKRSSQNATNKFVSASLKTLDKILRKQEKLLHLLKSDTAMNELMEEAEAEITGIKQLLQDAGTEQE